MAQGQKKVTEKVSAQLVTFADCLNPSKTLAQTGTSQVQKVFEFLEQNQKQLGVSIAKKAFAGSVAKGTSVVFPDFDCVVFLNVKEPPHQETVAKFKEILIEHANTHKIVTATMKTTPKTVSFEFSNGVEVDLLPATSYDQHSKEEQYKVVLKKLRETPNKNLHAAYSSSLAPIQVEFMTCQEGAVNQLTRLAKYWFKLCTLDKNIFGGSMIMEILSVDVALEMDPVGKGKSFAMLPAFRMLLERVVNIRNLKIAFYRNGPRQWTKVTDFNSPPYNSHFDQRILKSENFIIEPANPYNNLAPNIGINAERLISFAEKMLDRLQDLETLETNDKKMVSINGKDFKVLINYEELFQPFFIRLRDVYPNSGIPTHICIDYKYQSYESAQVLAKVMPECNSFFEKNEQAKFVYKAVMNTLKFLVWGKAIRSLSTAPFADGIPNVSRYEEVKVAVQTFVNANFGVRKFITESPANVDHNDSFVTLTIPYHSLKEDRNFAVRFSMKWTTNQLNCVTM